MTFKLALLSAAALRQTIAIAMAACSVAHAQSASPEPSAADIGNVAASEFPAQLDAELWAVIKASDGTKAFEEYLKQYPNGRHAALARSRIAELQKTARSLPSGTSASAAASVAAKDPEAAMWRVVAHVDSTEGYQLFLKHHPRGKYALLAAGRLKIAMDNARWNAEAAEHSAWQEAESRLTPEGYAAYLGRYPDGQYSALARARSRALDQDAALLEESRRWRTAESGNRSQVEAYLVRYPTGQHSAAATSRLARLKKEEAEMIPGRTIIDCPDCPEMIVIPAGEFQMGGRDATPVHGVAIGRPFAIARTEITQRQWRAMMKGNPSRFSACDDCPVDSVSWNDAQRYVEKLSRVTGRTYRLPSEAEWEYACRAGGRHEYCGSDAADSVAWHGAAFGGGNSEGTTRPVARKHANAFGLHDMSGNVAEWVEDCWHATYARAPVDGSAWIDDACLHRVARGGSWLTWMQYVRAAYRQPLPPETNGPSFGFRPVWRLP